MADKVTDLKETKPLTWKFWQKKRYIVVMLAFFGYFQLYALRVNLSIAVVGMTSNRTTKNSLNEEVYEPEFVWTPNERGLVLGAFFYGYVCTQLLGGIAADYIGGHNVFGIGIFLTSFFTLFTPLAARKHFGLLIAVRVIEGALEGGTNAGIQTVWAKWSPPFERTRMVTITMAGKHVGTVFTMAISGILLGTIGWDSIFYVFGTVGCVWYVFWAILVRDSPGNDRFCSPSETEFIETSLGSKKSKAKIKHPWFKIMTSLNVWAIIVAHFAQSWGYYTLLTQFPTFLKVVLHYSYSKSGVLSALPYLASAMLLGFAGYLADFVQFKGLLTTTQTRRVFNCVSFLCEALFMIIAAYVMHPVWTVVSITIAVGLGAFAYSGFAVNHLDIAPMHAGVVTGFANTFSSISGVISPQLTGLIVKNNTVNEWRVIFFISAGIYVFGALFYAKFVSGEEQEWAKVADT